jgi:hypothetical protein
MTTHEIKVLSFQADDELTGCKVKLPKESFCRSLGFGWEPGARFHVQALDPDDEPWVRIGVEQDGSELFLQMSLKTARTIAGVLSALTLKDVTTSEHEPHCLTSGWPRTS